MSLTADPPSVAPAGGAVGRGVGRDARAAAAAHALAADRSAILVVPDYRDQEQLEAALAGRVDARSRASAPMRDSLAPTRYPRVPRATRDTRSRASSGNRSAVYAPAHDSA